MSIYNDDIKSYKPKYETSEESIENLYEVIEAAGIDINKPVRDVFGQRDRTQKSILDSLLSIREGVLPYINVLSTEDLEELAGTTKEDKGTQAWITWGKDPKTGKLSQKSEGIPDTLNVPSFDKLLTELAHYSQVHGEQQRNIEFLPGNLEMNKEAFEFSNTINAITDSFYGTENTGEMLYMPNISKDIDIYGDPGSIYGKSAESFNKYLSEKGMTIKPRDDRSKELLSKVKESVKNPYKTFHKKSGGVQKHVQRLFDELEQYGYIPVSSHLAQEMEAHTEGTTAAPGIYPQYTKLFETGEKQEFDSNLIENIMEIIKPKSLYPNVSYPQQEYAAPLLD